MPRRIAASISVLAGGSTGGGTGPVSLSGLPGPQPASAIASEASAMIANDENRLTAGLRAPVGGPMAALTSQLDIRSSILDIQSFFATVSPAFRPSTISIRPSSHRPSFTVRFTVLPPWRTRTTPSPARPVEGATKAAGTVRASFLL